MVLIILMASCMLSREPGDCGIFSPRARVVLLGLRVYLILRWGVNWEFVSAIDVGFLRWGQRDEPIRARLCCTAVGARG